MRIQRLKIVVKIEIAALLDENGALDRKKMEQFVLIASNLQNSGKQIYVVSSGAIALGTQKMGFAKTPDTLALVQAMAAIGQAELIKTYQRYFGEYNQMVAQVLLTNDVVKNSIRRENATNTFQKLMDINIIPVINENDAVSTEDIVQQDNYPLVLNVAQLVYADVILVKCSEPEKYLYIERGDTKAKTIHATEIFDRMESLQQISLPEGIPNLFPEKFNDINLC